MGERERTSKVIKNGKVNELVLNGSTQHSTLNSVSDVNEMLVAFLHYEIK